MDYGIEVPSYRRVDNEKEKKKLNFENGIYYNGSNFSFGSYVE